MRKSKYSEHQIIAILKAVEAGRTVKDVCREHELSEATYYKWKAKYGGMEAADIKRLRALEEETAKTHVCRVVFGPSDFERGAHKKALTPAVKRKLIAGIREQYQLSERRTCRIMVLQRSVNRFQPQPNRDSEVIRLLLELAHGRPEQGFPKLFKRLRRLGHRWNHKRVYRVYCGLKLNKRRKGKKRLPTRCPAPLVAPEVMNACWSADFMSDVLWG